MRTLIRWKHRRKHRASISAALAAAASLALGGLSSLGAPALAADTPPTGAQSGAPTETAPDLVTIPGSHNTAMGCASQWQPDCSSAALARDPESGLYTASFDLPKGDWEYKVAIGGTWDVSYGANGTPGGANIAYSTTEAATVTFYYDPATHRVWNTADGPVITLPGSLQSELGCTRGDNGGDWAPDCLAPLMVPRGDGTWTYSTDRLPAGSYELKVAHGLSWNENYGVDGAPGGPNYSFNTKAGNLVTFTYTLATHKLDIDVADAPLKGVGEQRAYWVGEKTLAWPVSLLPDGVSREQVVSGEAGLAYTLVTAPEGGAGVDEGAVSGGDSHPLTVTGDLPSQVTDAHPNLRGYLALGIGDSLTSEQVREALRGQVAVAQGRSGGALSAFTGVQLAPVLDEVYAATARDGALGVTWADGAPSFALWAPTARKVSLLTWNTSDPTGSAAEAADEAVRTEAQAGADGTWRVANADGAITKGAQFQWEVEVYVPSTGKVETNTVTDPYSVALTTDSTRSVAIDLSDGALAPAQWASTPAPKVRNDASRAIYELHVRDFSAKDQSVPEEMRGTYKAFTVSGSAGMTHLGELAGAGMNTVHLLPTFDIATIPEKRAEQKTPQIPEGAGPASEEQQAAVSAVADEDAFNWGYDPLHWMAPEGSYATDANQNGGGRTVEFREMVGALHATGLQVVLDQVYNHTAASGQDAKSVLDRIVPGYYQRLNASGGVENSTCCSNVATENAMSERLMIDSLVMWARHYHVDGFRFDLMGHHSRQTMERAKAALSQLTLEADGVDGSSLYLYGEGWNFGEVANNALFTQATQGQLDGTGIGAFNDRLRDAVHGGGPFDEDHRVYQGFGSGAFSDPNGLDTRSEAERQADYQHRVDLVKIGLTGNLKGYAMTTYDGRAVTGEQLDYNGQGAGYASQPAESVNYVDAHDNETLFDLLTYKLPTSVPMGDRVRMNTLSLATVALGQSPSFWSSGTEILRSKSLDRDSFNSGDHFNAIDWTGQDNGFGAGLPVASKNGDKWPIMRPLLEDASLKPAPADIASAKGQALDLLRLRASTPLFALGSAELVGQKVTFPDSGAAPGSLTMLVDDTVGADADPALDGVLAVFNASDKPLTQTVGALAGRPFQLSDVQAGGSDEVVKGATFDAATGTLTVPARTVAVFTQATGGVGPQPLTGQWMKDGSRWWYRYSDGTYPSSTRLTIDGADYAFDAQGWMVTGWDSTDGQWRYYGSSGAAVSGWLRDGGSWYYLDPATKAMATGWLELGGTWYHLAPSGAMSTGWARVDGQWYHFGPSGAMDRGWLYVRGSWFYLTDSGAMAIGWVPDGGSWYYMHASGVMATGTQIIDGTTYRFSSSGRWIG